MWFSACEFVAQESGSGLRSSWLNRGNRQIRPNDSRVILSLQISYSNAFFGNCRYVDPNDPTKLFLQQPFDNQPSLRRRKYNAPLPAEGQL